jgi:hypothetical protein
VATPRPARAERGTGAARGAGRVRGGNCARKLCPRGRMQQVMPVLQCDHTRLHRPQEPDRPADDDRRQHREMHPYWRRECNFQPGGDANRDRAEKEDQEHCGPVAGILGREVEAAMRAGRSHRQEPGEDTAFAAARAAAGQRRMNKRDGRVGRPAIRRAEGPPPCPTSRCRQRGIARPRRRSANTKPPLRARNDASA